MNIQNFLGRTLDPTSKHGEGDRRGLKGSGKGNGRREDTASGAEGDGSRWGMK
jgi:hypothetical protein